MSEDKIIVYILEFEYEFHQMMSKNLLKINIGPQLSYLISFFQVFSMLVCEKFFINMEKCSQMHPYKKLIRLY